MAVVEMRASRPLAASLGAIFPLPLTVFETLMFLDSRPDYPMLADFELRFGGCIDRAAFDAALAFALPRNPLFTSLIAPVPNAKHAWHWLPSSDQPAVDWAPEGTPLGSEHRHYVDLARQIGLKIWVRHAAERSTVLLQFHHACSDAVGLYGFLEDLLVGYNAAVPGSTPVEPRPLEPERLLKRGWLQVPVRSPLQQIFDRYVAAREGLRFCTEAPLPLPPQTASANQAGGELPFVTRTLAPEVTDGLRRAAAAAGGTRNDVLIRDLMLTLRKWHVPGARKAAWRNLRVCVPQNLRDPSDAHMPACNAISFAFITRRGTRCAAPHALLSSIVQETAAVRRWKLSLFFLGGLAAIQPLGLLNWFLQRKFCFSSAVLSNLGDPAWHFKASLPKTASGFAVGDLKLERIVGSPPVRDLTRAAIGVVNCGDVMTLSLRCDPHSYSPLDAQRLLDDYVSQLQATAAAASAVCPALQGRS